VTSDRLRLVDDTLAGFNAGDDAAVARFFHPDLHVYVEPQLATAGPLRGREAVNAWISAARANWSDLRMRVLDCTEHSGRVVGDVLIVGGRATEGGGWRMSFAMWFEEDLISEIRLFWHREDAMKALSE
jgi:ketosteroid isomerase-like protein